MASRFRPKPKVENSTQQSAAAAFTLPDSLECSEIYIPVVTRTRAKANWCHILEERDHRMKEIEEYDNGNKPPVPKSPFQRTSCDYIQHEVFVCLLPALEDALVRAKMWNAFHQPRCLFNGIDWIAQEIWNNNPRHPSRKYDHKFVFNIPWVRRYLIKNPRPLYPKSWLWPEEYAATVIQKTVRQYYIQREAEVQEMREFWRKLQVEKEHPELNENQFLAREFAKKVSAAASAPNPNKRKKEEHKQEEENQHQETNKEIKESSQN